MHAISSQQKHFTPLQKSEMGEFGVLVNEMLSSLKSLPNINEKYTTIICAEILLCAMSIVYCVVGFYHEYYKGLICLIGSLAVTSATYVTIKYKSNPFGLLFTCVLVTFVFVHVMTRKWAYLVNDHDIVNDYSY